MIILCDFAKTSQSSCHFFYQYQHTLNWLLLSSRLLTNQTSTEAGVVDCQINVGKFLFGA